MILNFQTSKNFFLLTLAECNIQSHYTNTSSTLYNLPLDMHKSVICILHLKTKGGDNVYSGKKNSFLTRAKVQWCFSYLPLSNIKYSNQHKGQLVKWWASMRRWALTLKKWGKKIERTTDGPLIRRECSQRLALAIKNKLLRNKE